MKSRTICRCCSAACGIVVEHDAGQVLHVSGDPDNQRSNGYLCPKGASLPYFHHHPERLDQPLLQGRAVEWRTCTADLAARLQALIAKHGPDCVAVYQGTGTASDSLGMAAIQNFLRAIGSTQFYSAATVDVAPVFRAAEMVCGSWYLFPTWVPEDPQSRFALLIGFNPAVSHGYLTMLPDATQRLRAFRRRGGKLWLLDPRRTRTAALMDRHLAIKPGTDAVLLAWLIRELLQRGADRSDYERLTLPADRAVLERALEPYSQAVVTAATGLTATELDELLQEIRAAGRIAVMGGTGVTLSPHALITEWLKWVLLIVTGSLDQPGGMWFNPGWLTAMEQLPQWRHSPPAGDLQPGPQSRPDLQRMFGQNPSIAIVDEIEAGNIRALFVAGASPLTAFPDPERTTKAFARLEVLAPIDLVATPLTQIATHVLCATGQLERADLVLETQTIYAPAAVAPAGSRLPMWRIFADIARGMGLDTLGGRDPLATTDADLIREMAVNGREGADVLMQAAADGVTPPRLYGWVRQHALPEGRWRLVPPDMLERLRDLLGAVTADPRLLLVAGRQLTRTNSTPYMAPAKSPDAPSVSIHPEDAASLGIAEGESLTIVSDAGEVNSAARLDASLRPGVVWLSHGWFEANVCQLTSSLASVDVLTGQPRMTAIPVTLRRRTAA